MRPNALRPDLPLSAVAAVAEEAAAAGWPDTIPMAGGEPRFPPPAAALDALRRAEPDALTKYSPFRGTAEFLDGVRRKLAKVNGVSVGTDELIAVPGGAQALFSALSVFVFGQRRQVVVTDPCWEHYERIALAAGAEVVRVPTTRVGAHDAVDLDALATLVTERTAVVLLNTPLNPTGSVLTAQELEGVGEICAGAGARLVVDEEYETFTYGGHQHVTARAVRPDAVSLFSISKSFAMTGVRMGYVSAEPHVVDALKRFGLFTYMYSASPSLVMSAALLHDDGLETYLAGVRSAYEAKTAALVAQLDAVPGVECAMPEGGVYVFPRIPGPDGTSVTMRLVRDKHLLCVPGEAAGTSGRGHVRMFVGLDDQIGRRAVARVRELMADLAPDRR